MEIWTSVVPLICFCFVEWHQPDRVVRQFGYEPVIPVDPYQEDILHLMDLRSEGEDWPIMHAVMVNIWEQRANRGFVIEHQFGGITSYHSTYMEWYRKITRRWVTPSGALVAVVADGSEWIYDCIHGGSATEEQLQEIEETAYRMLGACQERARLLYNSDDDDPPDAPSFERAPPTTFTQSGRRRNRRGLADVRPAVHYSNEEHHPIRRTHGRPRNIPIHRSPPSSPDSPPPPHNEQFGGGSTSYVPLVTDSQFLGGGSTTQMPPPLETQQYGGYGYSVQESQLVQPLQPNSQQLYGGYDFPSQQPQLDLQLHAQGLQVYGGSGYQSQQPLLDLQLQTQSQQFHGEDSSWMSTHSEFQAPVLDTHSHFPDIQPQCHPQTPAEYMVSAFGRPSCSGPVHPDAFQQYREVRPQRQYTLDENFGHGLNFTNLLDSQVTPPIVPIPQRTSRYGRTINQPECGTGGHLGGHPHPRPPQ